MRSAGDLLWSRSDVSPVAGVCAGRRPQTQAVSRLPYLILTIRAGDARAAVSGNRWSELVIRDTVRYLPGAEVDVDQVVGARELPRHRHFDALPWTMPSPSATATGRGSGLCRAVSQELNHGAADRCDSSPGRHSAIHQQPPQTSPAVTSTSRRFRSETLARRTQTLTLHTRRCDCAASEPT